MEAPLVVPVGAIPLRRALPRYRTNRASGHQFVLARIQVDSMTKDTSDVVARLTTDAEFLARKRGSYPTIGKDCAEAAALISSLVAENERLKHDVESAGALRLRMEAHKSARAEAERLLAEARASHAAARQNFITMQQAAAVLLKRVEKATEHLGDIIRAYDANSGAEPSVSVLARAIDEARASIGGGNG
jgi:hypothetical protein